MKYEKDEQPWFGIRTHLKVPERALNTVLSLVLSFCLFFVLSITHWSHSRPIVNLKLHIFLCGCCRLRGRCTTCIWRWTWKLSTDCWTRLVEIQWQLRALKISQSYILLKLVWLNIRKENITAWTYTNKWHKDLARIFFFVVNHRFSDGNLRTWPAAVNIPLDSVGYF